ncbi:MAG: ferrous iron transport protein B [Anaerolineae bacterium]
MNSLHHVLSQATVTQGATIALAGQPNVGKSTVFNILTGLNQHVGNWPGKTVERKTGSFVHDGVAVDIVDLPGAYSLTAASPEEMVTRDYIIREAPDVVLVIVNAACLERSLYLVAELLALPAPLVIGLNMIDVARQEGFGVEPAVLAAAIGVPVIPMTATRNQGVHELIDAALAIIRAGSGQAANRPEIRADHQEVLAGLRVAIAGHVPQPYPEEWVAVKLLEGDPQVTALLREAMAPEAWAPIEAGLRQHEDAFIAVASGRYEWIRRMTRAALRRPRAGRITFTQRLDSVATHPFWGLVLLAGVLGLLFGLTYSVGAPMQAWIGEYLVGGAAGFVQRWLAAGPAWLSSLLSDGVIGGVGTMVTFVPILAIFFAAMGLLEDTGYMARAAYVMDRFMHAIGLHGKSFVPLFLGFGCNVPAVMGTRVIESNRDRLLTIMLAPLVPCAARLSVLAVLAPIFFPGNPTLASWALTGLPLVVLAVLGAVGSRLVLKGEGAAFIMEMPLYHVPNGRTIGIYVWKRILAFLQKAGTVILAVSVLVWALANLPAGEVETSYLASIGRALTPVGNLLGVDWRAMVAMLTSFVAKENVIATMGVLYGAEGGALAQALAGRFSVASGLAFLVAQMLFLPCASTVAVMRQETGSWKLTALNVVFMAVLAVLAGAATYRLALAFL